MQSPSARPHPNTFGTSAVGELYGRPYAHQFVPIIRRNTKLPATRTEPLFKMFDEQDAVSVRVYQGEDPDALKNVEIGSFEFEASPQARSPLIRASCARTSSILTGC